MKNSYPESYPGRCVDYVLRCTYAQLVEDVRGSSPPRPPSTGAAFFVKGPRMHGADQPVKSHINLGQALVFVNAKNAEAGRSLCSFWSGACSTTATTMHLQPPTIDNMVIVSSLRAADAMIPPQLDEVSFTIHGPPFAQNGWKLAWRNRRRPVLYDSLHNHKAALGRGIIKALIEFEQFPCPLFSTDIRIELTFVLRNGASKDIDNMMKYVFDAMQGIIYANDASIMVAIVKKVQVGDLTHHQENESTTVKISRIPTTVTTGRSTII